MHYVSKPSVIWTLKHMTSKPIIRTNNVKLFKLDHDKLQIDSAVRLSDKWHNSSYCPSQLLRRKTFHFSIKLWSSQIALCLLWFVLIMLLQSSTIACNPNGSDQARLIPIFAASRFLIPQINCPAFVASSRRCLDHDNDQVMLENKLAHTGKNPESRTELQIVTRWSFVSAATHWRSLYQYQWICSILAAISQCRSLNR